MTQLNRESLQPDSPVPGAGSRPQLSVGLVLLDQFTLAAFSGFVDVLPLVRRPRRR
ncbi:hypothetical protein [Pseudomonas sp. VI4.1]|uniref:hypothetical protein n=1 Tax=Pseudomonas sp. VI4.1 TaxID=1941346 RepID=UPI001C48671C|nr:hypothetical protein [Pseudomonas sp. VI4.1]